MFAKSTSLRLARALLWVHFSVVAWTIVAIWPSSILEAWMGIPLITLLCLIAIRSNLLADGESMGWVGFLLHAILVGVLVGSAIRCWGPFCFEPQPVPGDISGFGRGPELALAVRLFLLLLVYSGIPLCLELPSQRKTRELQRMNSRVGWISSLLLFSSALLTTVLLRTAWRGTEAGAAWIGGSLWASSFAIAAYLSARGDRVSTPILLFAAGILGFVRTM